jgi:hypothetical protein
VLEIRARQERGASRFTVILDGEPGKLVLEPLNYDRKKVALDLYGIAEDYGQLRPGTDEVDLVYTGWHSDPKLRIAFNLAVPDLVLEVESVEGDRIELVVRRP